MNWLDITLASPVIGIACEPRLQFPHEMLNALKPTAEQWKEQNPNILFLVPGQGCLIQVKHGDGFVSDINGNNFQTMYKYEAKVSDVAGGFLRVSNPDPRKFSELAARAVDLIGSISDALKDPPIVVTRLGVVADIRLDEKSLPPGVEKFLSHAGKPWGEKKPAVFAGTVTVPLGSDDDWTYRCHHFIDLNTLDREGDVRARLDWQMLPKRNGEPVLSAGTGRRLAERAVAAATAYFEKFGSGALTYE